MSCGVTNDAMSGYNNGKDGASVVVLTASLFDKLIMGPRQAKMCLREFAIR